ncbi:DUF2850 domain-containing protein [Salinivibrio sp. ES.052]|uniref:DUF2850 domain-containing protein n=1 Tax=Salinivibrio sp. ES.052 TaxID=1882823 RepID=UPI00092A75A4|nr:DUF2850 domain-containing protein [Salinivibrio sp. ES.052]SIO01800.1 Protein of unknown function [Salinivibrio sp. ES.052]
MRKTKQVVLLLLFILFGGTGFLVATQPAIFAPDVGLSDLYGEWVEKDVAPYAADRFEIRPDGVYTNGSQITTEYQFDGDQFRYSIGSQNYVYRIENKSTLERLSPAHYTSFFIKAD